MENETAPEILVDARGHRCPVPTLKLRRALEAAPVGALIIWNPLIGAVTLAMFIAAYLLIDGFALVGLAWDQRRREGRGWAWLMVSGVVDVILAAVILAMGAGASAVLLGFIIAIDLLLAGVALVTIGLHARQAA